MGVTRKGQPGDWWIIAAGSEPRSTTLYWMGSVHHDGRPMWSYLFNDAAQFDSDEQALFNAKLLNLTGEIEGRLRDSLNGPKDANGMLLLRLEEGLIAHVRAYTAVSLWGPDIERVGIELIRDRMIAFLGDRYWGPQIAEHLPEPYRSAHPHVRRLYESLAR